ncbi:MAG: Holliday junction branch migration protein RuvA [Propionibacteriaceae bacterium]|jgi:Holliday junction DNA helicase RuvA|nr:Holliday junction branch migration protein RuvA [Propionibacteriaceae bacterium]
MIAQLSGKIVHISGSWVAIDVNGFGMKAFCTPTTAAGLRLGQQATLHTSMIVRQDAVTLYGFADADERDCFELVQSASGIGPKMALATVAVLSPAELRAAVAQADLKTITKVPGIGNKVAQRLVIELKDKIGVTASQGTPLTLVQAAWQQQVKAGLEGLGYSSKDADAALDRIADLAASDPPPQIAILLRAALRSLAK